MPPIQSGGAGQAGAENLNCRLVHFTKPNSPNDPVHVAFSVTDETGNEMIITGQCFSGDLYQWLNENGWLQKTGGGGGIRTMPGRRTA